MLKRTLQVMISSVAVVCILNANNTCKAMDDKYQDANGAWHESGGRYTTAPELEDTSESHIAAINYQEDNRDFQEEQNWEHAYGGDNTGLKEPTEDELDPYDMAEYANENDD